MIRMTKTINNSIYIQAIVIVPANQFAEHWFVYHYLDNLENNKESRQSIWYEVMLYSRPSCQETQCTFSPFTSLKICYHPNSQFILLGILKSLTTPFFAFVFKSSLTAPNPVRKRNHSLLSFFLPTSYTVVKRFKGSILIGKLY